MKIINQLLSFLLVFQLLTGCQSAGSGAGPITKVNPPEAPALDISFEGTISRLSNIIFPSAHAANGVIVVNDYSNPDIPKELTRFDVINQNTFSFSLNRTEILGKLLKLNFLSSDGDEFSRQFLLTTSENQNEVFTELSTDTTTRFIIVEEFLKRKVSEGLINSEDISSGFADYSSLDIAPLVQLMGQDILFKVMTNPQYQKVSIQAFVDFMASKESGDLTGLQKSLITLSELSDYNGTSKNIYLICEGNRGQVSFNHGRLKISAKGVQEYVIRKFSGSFDLGYANNWEEGNKIIGSLVEILAQLSDHYGENLQAEISFSAENGEVASCLLSGKDLKESEYVLNPNPSPFLANFESLEALTYSSNLSIDEFQNEATSLFIGSLQELKWLLNGAALDPSERLRILKNEYQRGFSIIFSKIKIATVQLYGDYDTPHELDITSFENLEKAEEAIQKDPLYGWNLEMSRWYFGKFYF